MHVPALAQPICSATAHLVRMSSNAALGVIDGGVMLGVGKDEPVSEAECVDVMVAVALEEGESVTGVKLADGVGVGMGEGGTTLPTIGSRASSG